MQWFTLILGLFAGFLLGSAFETQMYESQLQRESLWRKVWFDRYIELATKLSLGEIKPKRKRGSDKRKKEVGRGEV